MKKAGVATCIILFVLEALLCLWQMWFTPLGAELFWKLFFTLAALFVVVLGVTIAVTEYLSEKEMKKQSYIDG